MSHSGNPNDPNDKSHLFDDDADFGVNPSAPESARDEFDDIDPEELAAAKAGAPSNNEALFDEEDEGHRPQATDEVTQGDESSDLVDAAAEDDAVQAESGATEEPSAFDFEGQQERVVADPDVDDDDSDPEPQRREPTVETDFEAVAARSRGAQVGAQSRADRRKRAAVAGAGALVFFGGVLTVGYLALSGGAPQEETGLVPATASAPPIAPMGAPVGSSAADDFYASLPQPETMAAVVTDEQRAAIEGRDEVIDEGYQAPPESMASDGVDASVASDLAEASEVSMAEPDLMVAMDDAPAEDAMESAAEAPAVEAEAPALIGGPATRAWSQFISGVVEPMMQRVTVRLDDVDQRVAAVEQRVESYSKMSAEIQKLREEIAVVRREQKVAAAAPRRAPSASVSAQAPKAQAPQIAANDPRVVLDRYTIETPDGLLTRAKLWFDESGAKGLKADQIKVTQADAGNGRYAVTVEIPNAVVNERPPAAKGFIRTARTYILPEVRKFEYIAGKEIDIDVALTDEAVDILMGPAGHRDTETAMLARASKPNAQWKPVAVSGMRRLADGRLVQVYREPEQTARAGITGRQDSAPLSYVSPSRRGVAVVPSMSTDEALAYRSGAPNPSVISGWGTSAMTDTLAIIVNNLTGQRISVMTGTFIPSAGTVVSINLAAREVVTDRGRILPLR